jgi:hypothetical protein
MKFIKFFIGLFIIALICNPVSTHLIPRHSEYQIGEQEEEHGNSVTVNQDYKGELVGKVENVNNGLYYVELLADDGVYHSSLGISKTEFEGTQMGENYEWNFYRYPNGMESVSFHRI